MRARRLGIMPILVLALLAAGIPAALAQTELISPIDVEPTQEELDFYTAQLPCPQLPGHELVTDSTQASSFTSADVTTYPNINRRCQYTVTGGNTNAVDLTVWWEHPDLEETFSCAGEARRDDSNDRVFADGPTGPVAARWSYNLQSDSLGVEADIEATIDAWTEVLRGFARTCAEPAIRLDCPSVDGFATPEIDQVDYYIEEFSARCDYENAEGFIALTLIAHWVPPGGGSSEITQSCSEETLEYVPGFGVAASDGQAAYTTYWIRRPSEGPDAALAVGAAATMTTAAEAQARSCEGLETFPASQLATPLPDFLAAAFAPEHVVLGSADTTPAATTTTTEGSTTTAASGSAAPSSPQPIDDDGSGLQELLVYAGTALSVLLLLWSLYRSRRESRIRPTRDVIRVVLIAGAAIGALIVLKVDTPVPAIAGGIAVGAALGLTQGRNLLVRLTPRGVYARRSTLAVLAFAGGIAVTQVAAVLNRTGAVALGVGISFLSAAMASGVIVGRIPKVRAARAGSAVGIALALATGSALVGLLASPTDAQEENTNCFYFSARPEERCVAHELLIDKVDWTSVQFFGGLHQFQGKPLIEMAVPRGLDTPPDPVTRTIEWSDEGSPILGPNSPVTTYLVDETFTFGLRDDGLCCTIEYIGESVTSSLASDGSIVQSEISASARMFDIQAVGSDTTAELGSRPGIPFGEQTQLLGQPEDSCVRGVGEVQPNMMREGGEWTSYVVDGENRTDSPPHQSELGGAFVIPCDIPDFSVEDALAVSPPPPPPDDPARIRGRDGGSCPVLQETMATLSAAGAFPGADTRSVGDLYLDPNLRACSRGALFTPLAFGEGGPGNTRHELIYDIGFDDEAADAERLADALDTLHDTARPYEVKNVCETQPNGTPIPPAEDGGRCEVISRHETAGGGQIFLWTDYQYFDGPNVFIRAVYPWGQYRYRCHHCEPSDPRIPAFLTALNDFMRGAREDLSGYIGDGFDVVEEPDTSEDDELEALVDLLAGEDATELEEALIATIISLIAAGGVAATTLLEGREEDLGVVDEYGDTLYPRDDGLYPWEVDGDTVWVDRDRLDELIAEATEWQRRGEERDKARARIFDENVEADRIARRERNRQERLDEIAAKDQEELLHEDRMDLYDAAEAGGYDDIIEFLDEHPTLTPDQVQDLYDSLNRRAADEAALEEIGDVDVLWETLKETQEDLGVLGRVGIAVATGGWSEVIAVPVDIAIRLREAQEQSLEETGEMMSSGDLLTELGKAVGIEIVFEVGGRGVAAGLGRLWDAVRGSADDVIEGVIRQTDEVAEAASRQADDLMPVPPKGNEALRDLPAGSQVTDELIEQTGYTREHLEKLAEYARQRNIQISARTSNPYSAAHIANGSAIPKPLDIKAKTINDIDVLLGADSANRGTVGLFNPTMPPYEELQRMGPELRQAIEDRYQSRLKEFVEKRDTYLNMDGVRIEGGQVQREVIIDGESVWKNYAGDMDLVDIRYADGTPVPRDVYNEVVEDLKFEGLVEHGGEAWVVEDVMRSASETLEAAMREGDELAQAEAMDAYLKSLKEAMDLRLGLETAQQEGEIIVRMLPDGSLVRGDQVDMLLPGRIQTDAEIDEVLDQFIGSQTTQQTDQLTIATTTFLRSTDDTGAGG